MNDLAFYRLVRSILFVDSSQQVAANNIMLLLKSAVAMRRCLHVCGYELIVCSHAYIMLSQKSCNFYCSKPHFCIFFDSQPPLSECTLDSRNCHLQTTSINYAIAVGLQQKPALNFMRRTLLLKIVVC
jgi:hypothetical protein